MNANSSFTSPPPVPRLDRNAIIGIWIETTIWGMNLIVYGLGLFVLFKRVNQPRLLLATSTILFLLGTAHVALSLSQLLAAFINIPDPAPPLYSILYWADYSQPQYIAKVVIYDTTVFFQDLVLIWRLYVVWGRMWQVIVLPIILEMAHMSTAYAATVLLSLPGASIDSPKIVRIGPVGWSLDLAVNLTVTAAIVGRLWYMGKKVGNATNMRNKYLTTIFTIVESGFLFAGVTIVMLTLYERGSILALNGIDISTQLAVLTPLMIIVRGGIGMVHGVPAQLSYAYENTTSSMRFTRSGYALNPLAIAETTSREEDDTGVESDLGGKTKTLSSV